MTRLIAPILPFKAEEIFDAMHEGLGHDRPASVHVALFPAYVAEHDREELISEWGRLLEIRQAASKALEELRQTGTIGNSLEARVILSASGDSAQLLRRHAADLRYIFIVSQVEIVEEPVGELRIQVERAEGKKCERCWNYSVAVGADGDFPTLCERCVVQVEEMFS
jgi:isoleucyl-tRNA synthetase